MKTPSEELQQSDAERRRKLARLCVKDKVELIDQLHLMAMELRRIRQSQPRVTLAEAQQQAKEVMAARRNV